MLSLVQQLGGTALYRREDIPEKRRGAILGEADGLAGIESGPDDGVEIQRLGCGIVEQVDVSRKAHQYQPLSISGGGHPVTEASYAEMDVTITLRMLRCDVDALKRSTKMGLVNITVSKPSA